MSTVSGVTGATVLSGYRFLCERLAAEFVRCPALTLTPWQMSEWLELDDDTSEYVLASLADAGRIERGEDGRYRLLLRH